jgi:histidine triad (HIT) family protein
MSESDPTVFERIVAREIPADIVYEDEEIIAFSDIAPKADLHVLVVPKTVYPTVVDLAETDPALLGRLVVVAKRIADERANGEFRLVFNSGASTGQSVFHVHGHVLSGGLDEGSVGHEL